MAPSESSTGWGITVEVKLTGVKFWIIVVTWFPLWELSAPRSSYYNCFFLWTQAPLSVKSLKGKKNRVKNLSTNERDWRGKPGDHWKHLSPVKKLMSLKKLYHWWKTSQPMRETEEENQTRDQSMKNLPTQWGGDWRGKPDKRSINEKSSKPMRERLRRKTERS